jgi:hypothetical protein
VARLDDPGLTARHLLLGTLREQIAERVALPGQSARFSDPFTVEVDGEAVLHLDIDMDAAFTVIVSDVEVYVSGRRYGTRAILAIKAFCDQQRLAMVGVDVISSFWAREEMHWWQLQDGYPTPWLRYAPAGVKTPDTPPLP